MLIASRMYGCVVAILIGFQLVTLIPAQAHAENIKSNVLKQKVSVHADETRTLNDTVRMAFLDNPKLSSADLSAQMQGSVLEALSAEFLPQLKLQLGLGREDSNNSTTRALTGAGSDEYERREASIYLRQHLYDGNKKALRQRGLESRLDAELEQYRYELSLVAIEAIEAHLLVMKANQVLKFNIANLEAHERIAKNVGIRARSGKDDRAKVNQISARLSLALSNVEAAKQGQRLANARYRAVTGNAPGSRLSYSPVLLSMPETKAEFIESVLSNHVELSTQRLHLQSLKEQYKSEKASLYPEVYVEAGASWNDNLDGVRGRNNDAFVMLKLDYDLFDGGASSARRQFSALEYERAVQDFEVRVRELKEEAEQVWYDYLSSSRRDSLLTDYVESAQSTKSAYIKQFDIGQRSLIDLLDAENELLQAQRMQADVRFELRSAKHRILFMQGQLSESSDSSS